MRTRTAVLIAILVATYLVGGPAYSAAATARAHRPVPAADLNGDGYGDLAVGTPAASERERFTGGCVVVLYGGPSGVSPRRSTTLSQDAPGVPGVGEREDEFGHATSTGDLDADGHADLAVGLPGEDADGIAAAGRVLIFWGAPGGPVAPGGSSTGGAGPAATALRAPATVEGERFGQALAVGDVTGDGRADLVVASGRAVRTYAGGLDRTAPAPPTAAVGGFGGTGVRVEEAVAGDFTGTGDAGVVVHGRDQTDPGRRWLGYYTGGPGGLTFRRDLTDGAPGTGGTAATGDIDGDGRTDLVTGAPESGPGGSGTMTIRYGSPGGPGLGARAPITFSQNSAGVPGAEEADDHFGAAVAAGDVTGDGRAEVVIGVPDEDIGGRRDTGGVVVLLGSAQGVTTTGARAFHQATAGVPGVPEAGDRLGSAAWLGDAGADGHADLAMSAAGEDVTPGGRRDGAVWVLRGTGAGVGTAYATSFSAPSFGFTFVDRAFGSTYPD